MRTATFQFSESVGSVNGPNLFTELPFLYRSLTNPSFTELPLPFSLKTPVFIEKCFVASPSQKSALTRGGMCKGRDVIVASWIPWVESRKVKVSECKVRKFVPTSFPMSHSGLKWVEWSHKNQKGLRGVKISKRVKGGRSPITSC